MTEHEFVNSAEKEAEVEHFKRFKIFCLYEFHQPPKPFSLVVNPRSNLVTLALGSPPSTKEAILKGMNESLKDFFEEDKRFGNKVIHAVRSDQKARSWICRVKDGAYFVNVLHDLSENPENIRFNIGGA